MSGPATWERVGQNSGLLLHWVPDNSGQAPLMISHWLGLADFTIVEHFGQRVCILRICADGGHDQAGIRGPRAKTHQRVSLSHGIMRPATMSWLAPAAPVLSVADRKSPAFRLTIYSVQISNRRLSKAVLAPSSMIL